MPPKSRRTRQTKQASDRSARKRQHSQDSPPPNDPLSEASSNPVDSIFEVEDDNGKKIACQRYGNKKGIPGLVFTHGASGGLSNPATRAFVKGFSEATPAVCFKGSMNLQSRVKGFHIVIDNQGADSATLGGRSMGARAAVLAAGDHPTATLVLVSYPLIGQNGAIRDQILFDIDASIAVLFVSGDRDNMCPLERLAEIRPKMKAKSWLMTIRGADHGMSLTPTDATDRVREYTGRVASRWVKERDATRTESTVAWDKEAQNIDDSGWQQSLSESSDDAQRSAKRRKKA